MDCELCQADEATSFHHFIPRTLHHNKWFAIRFDKLEMRSGGIQVCKQCHNMLHDSIPHKELGREFNTLGSLREHPQIADYLRWKRRRVDRPARADD